MAKITNNQIKEEKMRKAQIKILKGNEGQVDIYEINGLGHRLLLSEPEVIKLRDKLHIALVENELSKRPNAADDL